MPEKSTPPSKSLTIDWLVRGVLTKFGDAFDGFTGRKWQPSSNLATSEICERLRALVDSQVRDFGPKGRFVPHIIRLKVDWETFGTESSELLEKLERELTVALVDHINDRRYHTLAPLDLKVKTDYFTKGVKLTAGFDGASEEEREIEIASPMTVSVVAGSDTAAVVSQDDVGEEDSEKSSERLAQEEFREAEPVSATDARRRILNVRFKGSSVRLEFTGDSRKGVGRGASSDLPLDDPSVSRNHASLVFSSDGTLFLADTGSTNGTFLKGERVAYGRAVEVPTGSEVRFGDVSVIFEYYEEEATGR